MAESKASRKVVFCSAVAATSACKTVLAIRAHQAKAWKYFKETREKFIGKPRETGGRTNQIESVLSA
jgi:hypothetical protein